MEIIEKINAAPARETKKFKLNQVTICVSQNKPKQFTAIAMETNSPLYFRGTSTEVAAMFARLFENTFNSMELNGIKTIKIIAKI